MLATGAVAGFGHVGVGGHVAVELVVVKSSTLSGVLALLAHLKDAVLVVGTSTGPAERDGADDAAVLADADALVRDINSRSRSRGRGGEGS